MKRIKEQTLKNIADAIREKAGTTDPIKVKDMASAIADIPSGGGQIVKLPMAEVDSNRSTCGFPNCPSKPKYIHLVYGMLSGNYYSGSSVIGAAFTLKDDGTYTKVYESHFNGSSQGMRYYNYVNVAYKEDSQRLEFTVTTSPTTYGFTPTTTYGKYMCWVVY